MARGVSGFAPVARDHGAATRGPGRVERWSIVTRREEIFRAATQIYAAFSSRGSIEVESTPLYAVKAALRIDGAVREALGQALRLASA